MGLPEWIGGERNWDYRYTWLRDAAFALYALISVGFDDEAKNFMGWLKDRCHEDADGLLQPLYGIDGRSKIDETVLSHLSGYKGSRPVRLGNAAHTQVQLDLYGSTTTSGRTCARSSTG
jgi:GH15 family glucan-1,4-alpha-glucosidase